MVLYSIHSSYTIMLLFSYIIMRLYSIVYTLLYHYAFVCVLGAAAVLQRDHRGVCGFRRDQEISK